MVPEGRIKEARLAKCCQQAAYQTVKLAIQILQKKTPERLYESLTHVQDGQRVRKIWKQEDLMRLNLSTRKAWSTRALRWIEMMPASMLVMDLSFKSSKQSLKAWIKHRVPPRGDKVLWGKPLREAGAPQGGQDVGEDEEQQGGLGPDREDAAEDELQAPQRQLLENLVVEEQRERLVGEESQDLELLANGKRTWKTGHGQQHWQEVGLRWPRSGGLHHGDHLQAGHQLCPPRRRHSPARGLRDTTGCPRWRAARQQVTNKHHLRLLTLTLYLPRKTLRTKDVRQTCRTQRPDWETSGSWRASGEIPRSGVG